MREETIFAQAVEVSDPAARSTFLAEACAGDSALRRRVEGLLRTHENAGDFLNKPAVEQIAVAPGHSATQAFDPSTDRKEDNMTRTEGEGASDNEHSDLGFLQPATRPDSLGRIGHYETLQVLGKGGFGIVFRAFDDTLQRVVALKVMAPQLAATSPARRRFLREARSSAQVRHENVVQVYEVGETPLPYLAMEFIPGETLQQRLDRIGPVEPAEVVRIGRQIVEGLAAAHATDLIHRDIKPSNILIESGQQKAKLTDFGLARAADDASISQSGIIAGTPMYMAPEQAKGDKLDQRADLFSLGSVLYQMAAGRPPFRANSTLAVLKRVAEDTPRDIREIIPETPQWLCDIIAKLHAKNPDERFQSAREVADVLADCEAQLKTSSKLKDFSRIPRGNVQPSGRRKLVGATAVLLLPVLALAVTEFAGVTNLLRKQQPILGVAPKVDPKPEPKSPLATGGFALAFDGKNSRVRIPSLKVTEDHALTVETWTVLGDPVAPVKHFDLIANSGTSGFTLGCPPIINGGDSKKMAFAMRQKNPDRLIKAWEMQPVPRDQLIHLAGVYDGKAEVRYYVNGKLQSRTPVQDINPGNMVVTIGGFSPGVNSFHGRMNEVHISRVARYDTDFAPAKRFDPDKDTIALFHFDEGEGTVLKDSSGNGHHGEIIGAKWVRADGSELHEPAKPSVEGTPTPVAQEALFSDEWVSLFNREDLTGWKIHPEGPGDWRVKDGLLTGGGGRSYLFTDRGDYTDFHLRVEAKVSVNGNTGVVFRSEYGFGFDRAKMGGGAKGNVPPGYEADIHADPFQRFPTGTVWRLGMRNGKSVATSWSASATKVVPDEWITLEVIARGNSIRISVDGKLVLDTTDDIELFHRGHFALQTNNENPVYFRKIEIREPVRKKQNPDAPPPTFTNSLGMEFVIVPKGKSWLGGGKDKLGDQEVNIPADFYLGKYEVTQEEWTQVMGQNPSHFSRTGKGMDAVKDIPDADLKRFPVERVTWDQCQIFVENLNRLEKEAGWVYRLPTEAEWEYACRGGPMADKLDSAFDYYFAKPTNTLLPEQANYNKVVNRTCKAGTYEANRLGLFDMHGNVWEWCNDGERAADGTMHRAGRGGCWSHDHAGGRAGFHNAAPQSVRYYDLGLRLARVPAGAPSPEEKTPPPVVAPFTDADAQRIAALPAEQQVEEVRKELMKRNPGFDGTMETKIEDGVVTEFKIVTDKVTDISPLRAFNELHVLECIGSGNDTARNGQLSDLRPLNEMDLRRLTRLNLSRTKVKSADLAKLAKCPNLNELFLSGLQVNDQGLAHFEDCKNINTLWLTRTNITDAGLAYFKDCNLTSLHLNGTNVTDEGLAHFKDCNRLMFLFLHKTRVTNVGLAYFQNCSELSVLYINDTKITDLTLLRKLPLKELYCDFKKERDAEILRSIKTLERINDKPAAEFWIEVDKK